MPCGTVPSPRSVAVSTRSCAVRPQSNTLCIQRAPLDSATAITIPTDAILSGVLYDPSDTSSYRRSSSRTARKVYDWWLCPLSARRSPLMRRRISSSRTRSDVDSHVALSAGIASNNSIGSVKLFGTVNLRKDWESPASSGGDATKPSRTGWDAEGV